MSVCVCGVQCVFLHGSTHVHVCCSYIVCVCVCVCAQVCMHMYMNYEMYSNVCAFYVILYTDFFVCCIYVLVKFYEEHLKY